jgi:hypothetical protein
VNVVALSAAVVLRYSVAAVPPPKIDPASWRSPDDCLRSVLSPVGPTESAFARLTAADELTVSPVPADIATVPVPMFVPPAKTTG